MTNEEFQARVMSVLTATLMATAWLAALSVITVGLLRLVLR